MTFSWDEFIIAFLLTRFDVSPAGRDLVDAAKRPVAKVNAVGSVVFLVSVGVVLLARLWSSGGGNDGAGHTRRGQPLVRVASRAARRGV